MSGVVRLHEVADLLAALVRDQVRDQLVEDGGHCARIVRAHVGVLREEAEQKIDEGWGDVVALVVDVGRRLVEDASRARGVVVFPVEATPADHLEEHHPEGEEIRASVRLLEAELLG